MSAALGHTFLLACSVVILVVCDCPNLFHHAIFSFSSDYGDNITIPVLLTVVGSDRLVEKLQMSVQSFNIELVNFKGYSFLTFVYNVDDMHDHLKLMFLLFKIDCKCGILIHCGNEKGRHALKIPLLEM